MYGAIYLGPPKPPPALGYYYRYDDRRYAPPLNEYDEPMGQGRLEVLLTKFPVLKETPKGVWLDNFGSKRFVLHSAYKRFADSDLDKAKASFIARKKRQGDIYRARARQADEAILIIESRAIPTDGILTTSLGMLRASMPVKEIST